MSDQSDTFLRPHLITRTEAIARVKVILEGEMRMRAHCRTMLDTPNVTHRDMWVEGAINSTQNCLALGHVLTVVAERK